MADEALTDEDQKTVDETVQTLAAARDALTLKDNASGENGGNSQTPGNGGTGSADNNAGEGGVSSDTGSGSTNTGNSDSVNKNTGTVPKTGDMPAALPALLLIVCVSGAAAVMSVRSRKR